MLKENLYEPFSTAHLILNECPKQAHKHNFFELVFVLNGTGKQCINNSRFNYHAEHMFLITPEDCHELIIEETSELFFLRFNDIYLKNGGLQTENIRRLEYILQNANHQPGCILKNTRDKKIVRSLISNIIEEQSEKDLYNKELVQQLVNTLIIIVARNIAKYLPEQANAGTEEKAMDILQYVQSNIYYPEKLRADTISRHFSISEAYLGRYFKKHVEETLQQYIANYKTKLIEHRLQFSDKRLNEIANEFGFTDESHFNKFFRKQRGNSPKAFRKALQTSVLN